MFAEAAMRIRLFVPVIALALLSSMLTGCNPASIKRDSRLQDSLLYYKIQMNRSNFVEAAQFRNPETPWNVHGLERFQVSHYEVKRSVTSNNGNTVQREVYLRYIDRHSMRERGTTYRETWQYLPDLGGWRLGGEPPVIQ
jgi:hypothetical protein